MPTLSQLALRLDRGAGKPCTSQPRPPPTASRTGRWRSWDSQDREGLARHLLRGPLSGLWESGGQPGRQQTFSRTWGGRGLCMRWKHHGGQRPCPGEMPGARPQPASQVPRGRLGRLAEVAACREPWWPPRPCPLQSEGASGVLGSRDPRVSGPGPCALHPSAPLPAGCGCCVQRSG